LDTLFCWTAMMGAFVLGEQAHIRAAAPVLVDP
jgi:hypothetical protein